MILHYGRMQGTRRSRLSVPPPEDLASGLVELVNVAQIQISSSMCASSQLAVTIEIYGNRGTALYSDRPWSRVRFNNTCPRYRRSPVWAAHPMQASLEGIRRWIVDDKPFLFPAVGTLTTLASVEAIYASAEFSPPGPSLP